MAKRSESEAVPLTIYTTILGDAWDAIAFKIYGDEKHMKFLMEANPQHMETLIFRSGVDLNVPDLPEAETAELPFWRRSS